MIAIAKDVLNGIARCGISKNRILSLLRHNLQLNILSFKYGFIAQPQLRNCALSHDHSLTDEAFIMACR
jgi:hypothetical protein